MTESVEFPWEPEEFQSLFEACPRHEGLSILFDYLAGKDNNVKILEAGCGIGATVRFISEKGYKKVTGIELNIAAVDFIHKAHPELNIIQGDILAMPFEDNHFDLVASYGVVEHFPKGFLDPLEALFRVLKPSGIAIITIPVLNHFRLCKHYCRKIKWIIDPRKNNNIRALFRKPAIEKPKYYIYPKENNFFEYRITPRQFKNECRMAGFEIIESKPICHIDGLYHLFKWTGLISFKDWKFSVTKAGRIVNKILKSIPSLHNHMHALILLKK